MSLKKKITSRSLITAALVILTTAKASTLDSKFFANESIQSTHPEAFVLQPEAEAFVRALDEETIGIRNEFAKAIVDNPALYKAVQDWESLSFTEQVPYLKQIFEIEVKLMNINPPDLVISSTEIPGRAAFFDFDLKNPGAGRVILNPDVLKSMDKYASLALLIHETRHSAQLQMAFSGSNQTSSSARAYRAAFHAQKTEIRSFCDFLTLANEFEAFQFGNYVLGLLTGWKIDMPDMGTFASQYDGAGKLKLDLVHLLDNGAHKSLLEKFNKAEIEQCMLLGACP